MSFLTTSYEATTRLCFFTWCCNLHRKKQKTAFPIHFLNWTATIYLLKKCIINVPCSFIRGASIVQRIEILFRAELPNLIHPVSRQGGRTHNYGGHRATVGSLRSGVLLSPAHMQQHCLAGQIKGMHFNYTEILQSSRKDEVGLGCTWGNDHLPEYRWTAGSYPDPYHHTRSHEACTCSKMTASSLHPTKEIRTNFRIKFRFKSPAIYAV